MEKSADKKTAEWIASCYGESALNVLFDAVLNSKLPPHDYRMGEQRALIDLKSMIKENRAKDLDSSK